MVAGNELDSAALAGDPADAALLAALRSGDEAAFRGLVLRHHAAAVGLARANASSHAVAEEVAQETCLAATQGIGGFWPHGRSTSAVPSAPHSSGSMALPRRCDPERAVYNNALLDRDLGPTERATAVDAMEAGYDSAGVDRYAAWVHESDEGMRAELSSRGYTLDESTRAMGLSLDDISVALPEVELGPPDWAEYLRILGVPAGFLSGADPSAFHILVSPLAARTSRQRWPSTMTAIAACSTCPHSRRHGGEGSAPRSPHVTSTMPSNVAARPRAYSPRRWPSASTRRLVRELGRILEYVP
jgi:hypothetical protein